jgi:phosphoribosyl 1,2-cyclic phosphodiesterase
MASRFTVLASGSAGNATLLECEGFGLLIDCGLPPRELGRRLAAVGRSWEDVSAAVLTHTHGDHWNRFTLAHLAKLRRPLVAHPRHHETLAGREGYCDLAAAGLVRRFEAGRWLDLAPGLSALPVAVPHDADPTFGFRFEGRGADGAWAVGYASDVGEPVPALAAAFTGVDLLALEFNHDVAMQKASGRPALLIRRVLGGQGHLSNRQAAEVARAVDRSAGLRWLVPLHLSRDCNRPELATAAARLAAPRAELVVAGQYEPSAVIPLTGRPVDARRVAQTAPAEPTQPALPGL